MIFFVGRSLEEMEGKEDWGGEVNLCAVGSGCTCLCNAMATREQGWGERGGYFLTCVLSPAADAVRRNLVSLSRFSVYRYTHAHKSFIIFFSFLCLSFFFVQPHKRKKKTLFLTRILIKDTITFSKPLPALEIYHYNLVLYNHRIKGFSLRVCVCACDGAPSYIS